jgi:hypothetical protein
MCMGGYTDRHRLHKAKFLDMQVEQHQPEEVQQDQQVIDRQLCMGRKNHHHSIHHMLVLRLILVVFVLLYSRLVLLIHDLG